MQGKTWLVSRHQGTLEWFGEQGIAVDETLTHLEPEVPQPGDTVIGNLPIQMVAQLSDRGIHYCHLSLTVPPEWRGRELSSAEIEACQPALEYFRVIRGSEDE